MEKQGNLFGTRINEVKGIRGSKVHSTHSRYDIIDFDIPTINFDDVHTPEIMQYVESMIQAYNRYLGYSSGLTKANVTTCFKHGLRLYCYMRMLKRYYDAQTVTLPSGEKVEGIFDIMRGILSDTDGALEITNRHRISSTVKGVSNKVWVTDYINKVEQVLLPSSVMAFYDYYLSSLFDVSNNENKEAVTFMRFWICDEEASFISAYDPEDSSMPAITKTIFDNAYSALETVLTPTMRNFLTTFLGWKKPNQDWTRDITGNTLCLIRDDKVISTFNNIYPEKVAVMKTEITEVDAAYADNGNSWYRYYYDFEQLLNSDDADEAVATKYFFGIDGLNLEQAFLESNEQLNTIKLDYYNYLLLAILCSEEQSGSKEFYVGGTPSTVTSIDCNTGSYIPDVSNWNALRQFCCGNDISLKIYDFRISTNDSHDVEVDTHPLVSELGGIIGDYGEAGDFMNQIAIFNYPIRLVERWRYAQKWSVYKPTEDSDWTPQYEKDPMIDCIINGYWNKEWTATDQSASYQYIADHDYDVVAFNTYTLDPHESHLAMYTTLYYFLTGYKTYNEAICAIDDLFANKQQNIN